MTATTPAAASPASDVRGDASEPSPFDRWSSPLAGRNASPAMLAIFSPRHRFDTWRLVWLAIAEAEHRCGLGVSAEQVAELRAVVDRGISDEEIRRAAQIERVRRHDVMSHVECLGEACPGARPIIHLGCTSQDVVCNADNLILDEARELTLRKVQRVVIALGVLAEKHAAVPTLGFTHYQPAQPTTVGRRCSMWAAELELCAQRLRITPGRLPEDGMRGLMGATGTQASFLTLAGGDAALVERLEREFLASLTGVPADRAHPPHRMTGQTYPRVLDAMLLGDLACCAAVLHRIAGDLRLLCNRKEIDEPFEDQQIGSSAMPYKRNPMRCERICGLSRFVVNLVGNAYDTAAVQWLERTLDDSSNRRLSLPESFLAMDGALDLMHNVASGLVVHEAMVARNLEAELPFLATEHILMAAVQAGGDRQDLHEVIRRHSQEVGWAIKQAGADNDLIDRLRADPAFNPPRLREPLDWESLLEPSRFTGLAEQQARSFWRDVAEPLRSEHERLGIELGGSAPMV